MLSVSEAIKSRRSIRKFKTDEVHPDLIYSLIEAASLAPSSCNSQPWRFKIVSDQSGKDNLVKAAYNQNFISKAPVVIICCADISSYKENSAAGIIDLKNSDYLDENLYGTLKNRIDSMQIKDSVFEIVFNVAIAIENMILKAVETGLGTCWVGLVNDKMVKKMFNLDEKLIVAALLAVGYPAESPEARRRLDIKDIIIP